MKILNLVAAHKRCFAPNQIMALIRWTLSSKVKVPWYFSEVIYTTLNYTLFQFAIPSTSKVSMTSFRTKGSYDDHKDFENCIKRATRTFTWLCTIIMMSIIRFRYICSWSEHYLHFHTAEGKRFSTKRFLLKDSPERDSLTVDS